MPRPSTKAELNALWRQHLEALAGALRQPARTPGEFQARCGQIRAALDALSSVAGRQPTDLGAAKPGSSLGIPDLWE